MKLQVFGKLRLIYGNDKSITTSFSLLIISYIVIEHQGKINREDLYELFNPMEPNCPKNFNESSK